MKSLVLVAALVIAFPLALLAQDEDASLLDRAQAKRAAAQQLERALRNKDWKLVQESAKELEMWEKREKAAPPVADNVFERASTWGLTLSRSPDEEKKGARFGFSRDYEKTSDTVLEADFYLKWAKDLTLWNSVAISAQGKLSSANNKESDAWRFRLEDSLWTYNPQPTADRIFDGLVATLSAKSESDRDFKTTRLSGELWLTANARKLFVGQYSGNNDSFVQFRWRPYAGLDAGGTISDTASTSEDAKSALWFMARGRADLRLNFLHKLLKLSDAVAYVDDKTVWASQTGEFHNYLNTGIDFEFTDNVGLTLVYTIGEDSPKFVREQLFKGGLTVRLGVDRTKQQQ